MLGAVLCCAALDRLRPTVQDDSLELFPQAGSSFNIGIMVFRRASMAFVGGWTLDIGRGLGGSVDNE